MSQTNEPTEGTAGIDGASYGNAFKPTFIRTSIPPDVTLVIGGKEFKEYSHSLRSWSGQSRGLSSNMQEQTTYRFEFPDRCPDEWQWLVSLMAPMAKEKVAKENILVALDWYDFLCSDIGLAECDKIMYHKVLPKVGVQQGASAQIFKVDSGMLSAVLKFVPDCVKYNLKGSKSRCFAVLCQALTSHENLFSKDMLATVAATVKEEKDCRELLWLSLRKHIPYSISDAQIEILLQNDILHEVMYVEILPKRRGLECEKKDAIIAEQKEKRTALELRMISILDQMYPVMPFGLQPPRPTEIDVARAAFRNDDLWGPVVPNHW